MIQREEWQSEERGKSNKGNKMGGGGGEGQRQNYSILESATCSNLRRYFETFKGPRNQFQGIDSATLCSLAGHFDNPIRSRFLAPIDCSKIPALDKKIFFHMARVSF
jgi:hypothetical protein